MSVPLFRRRAIVRPCFTGAPGEFVRISGVTAVCPVCWNSVSVTKLGRLARHKAKFIGEECVTRREISDAIGERIRRAAR
jgi:hypothetical protein